MRRAPTLSALTLAVVALAASASHGAAQSFPTADETTIVGIAEDALVRYRQPGLIVGIWIPGRGEFVRAFGAGDIEAKAAMTTADHFRIASITKTFTAVAALRLVDQGRLRLDDVLEGFVPGIPNGDRITVRNLLGMTSGIYDFTSDEAFLRDFTANPQMPFTDADVIAIVSRHQPDFAPGEKVAYCDTNYALLGMILEKVTGRTAAEVIRSEVVEPLKLAATSDPGTSPAMPAPFARGYYAGDDGKGPLRDYTAINPAVAGTAGAMISTLADLRIWAKALATGALLTPATRKQQMTFGALSSGGALTVGYGLGIADIGGLIGHNGAIFGYTSAMFYVPAADATVVVIGNQSSNFSTPATDIAYALAKRLMPDQVQ